MEGNFLQGKTQRIHTEKMNSKFQQLSEQLHRNFKTIIDLSASVESLNSLFEMQPTQLQLELIEERKQTAELLRLISQYESSMSSMLEQWKNSIKGTN